MGRHKPDEGKETCSIRIQLQQFACIVCFVLLCKNNPLAEMVLQLDTLNVTQTLSDTQLAGNMDKQVELSALRIPCTFQ